VGIFKR